MHTYEQKFASMLPETTHGLRLTGTEPVDATQHHKLTELMQEVSAARASAESALRESERFRRILEQHSIISIADARGRIIQVNDAFCAISGYSREELIGQDHRIVNSGIHPRSFWVQVWRAIAGGAAWHGEICNRAKDGSLYWVDSIIAPFMDSQGKVERYVSIRNDITERKQNELALRQSAQRMSLAAKAVNMGVWEWDFTANTIRWDRTMFEIYGIVPTIDSMVEYSVWSNAVLPEELPQQEAVMRDTIRRCGKSTREFRILRADNEVRIIQSAETVISDIEGRPVLLVGVNRDVTPERDSERRLKESNEVIARQNRELSAMAERAHRVVDDVSHEFRTPLAAIKEFASIIADGLAGPVSQQQTEYLKIVDSAVVDLNHMVEDLLDSSKLRSGRLRVDRMPHSIETIFAAGRKSAARKASSRSIIIDEQIEPGLPQVFADEEKVRRIIGNLISNAIKFSPEGGTITLSAKRTSNQGEVVVSVTDQGPGLSQEDMDRLFGRFQQASTSRHVAAKGFGLGLSIARELSWLNLGTLSVASERGKGATFSFTLPENEPTVVLRRYLDALLNSDTPGDTLAVVRAEVTVPAKNDDMDEPRSFLAAATYATDIVIPSAWNLHEDASPSHRSWIVLGRTKSAEAWIARLQQSRSSLIAESGSRLTPVTLSLVESIPSTTPADLAFERVSKLISPEPHHAQ